VDYRVAQRFAILVFIALPVLLIGPVTAPLPAVQAAQEKAISNPLAGDPAAAKAGELLFRSNCSPCHGLNAHGGGRGPDLTSGRWVHGSSDSDIFHTISTGVPGTQMPANSFEDSETWTIVAYLRSLAPSEHANLPGDATQGERLFTQRLGCSSCHMVNGKGGLLGPDLSRVGASRSVGYLIDSIREPGKDLSNGMLDPNNHYGLPLVYDTVTVTLKSGGNVTGVASNEDTFSIQMIDSAQHLRLFQKSDLKSVHHERKSLMPAYSEAMIGARDLEDLLAYLVSLRGR
jgi:putative heme-binding domain-containing protein